MPIDPPQHLAIIMDGNGRWAEKRGLPRIAGHKRGVEVVQDVVRASNQLGIDYLTLFAFSSENWGRPNEEVSALMDLLGRYLRSEFVQLREQKIRLNVIGEIGRLPLPVAKVLKETLEQTRDNQGMVLTLALSYGSRDEICRAVKELGAEVAAGRIKPEEINEQSINKFLDTADLPDPDLLIRTSGEMRISNFLLWQLAYTELVFSPVLWPDFSVAQLEGCLRDFTRRERRFGLTGSQVVEPPKVLGD